MKLNSCALELMLGVDLITGSTKTGYYAYFFAFFPLDLLFELVAFVEVELFYYDYLIAEVRDESWLVEGGFYSTAVFAGSCFFSSVGLPLLYLRSTSTLPRSTAFFSS